MATTLLILAGVLFIVTLGIHATIMNGSILHRPMYTDDPILSKIPWISAFVLSVIAWANIFPIHWIILFFLNIGLVWLLSSWLTEGFLVRFASGKGLGLDMTISFIGGLVALILGILLK